MGRRADTDDSVCGCSPWSLNRAENSDWHSRKGKEPALGCFLSSEVGEAHLRAVATPNAPDSHVASKCHTCVSYLRPSQRALDGPRSSLGSGRQYWLRACNRQPCGKAGKRSGYCYLC